jgi:autotransporter passenger strand-loop-strand repeat protein
MEIITTKIERDLFVEDTFEVNGMVIGTVTVSSNGTLILRGMVVGDVIINPNSKGIIYGMVKGNLINQGGLLEVYGMVKGSIIESGGETVISSHASYNNKI